MLPVFLNSFIPSSLQKLVCNTYTSLRIHQLQQMMTDNHLLIIWNSLKDQSSPCVHVLGVSRSSNKQHYRPGRGPLGPWTQRLTLLNTNSRISDETNSETREQLRLIQLWTLTLTEASTWRNNLSRTEETVKGKLLTHRLKITSEKQELTRERETERDDCRDTNTVFYTKNMLIFGKIWEVKRHISDGEILT